MNHVFDPVLQAIVRVAVDATGASQGWVLRLDAATLRVVAAAGSAAGELLGLDVPADRGTAAFVIESGEPLALAARGGDARLQEGMAEFLGRTPKSVLAVPCSTGEEVVGALEMIDKTGAFAFSFDDAEVVSLLAPVAGAALVQGVIHPPAIPDPAQLGADLQRLAESDPDRYMAVATAVSAMLGHA
jgi:GAF domain-containing protein